ncbi:MAG: zinc-dependent metalloprotease [Planctomycetes bacterium]|nr:zinc-dependent metalloprotease [Planctomycetota bacterium]
MKQWNKIILCALCASAVNLISCGSTPKTPEKPKNGDNEKEFAEIIKDCKPIPGLFTIYHNEKDGKAYLEILPANLDKIFLCAVTRESGDSHFFDSASLEGDFPFFFKKINKRIQFIHKNVICRADKDKPIFRAIEKGLSDSITASAAILSKPQPETGALLVNLADFFLFDRQNIAHHLNEASKADYSFDKDNSYFSILKSFPDNTDIEVTLHFASRKPVSSPTSPDARSIILKYYYNILKLPEGNYVPRLADDRVGHFITMYQDYSSLKPETPYVRYVERWHLEKSDPAAELSTPKKHIVFWLEKTIPLEYRESIKKGILLWNKAFEKIGFKDAIVVNQQPDDADWDPADARYNTIRWMVNPGAGYAVGPSQADPFTGQIYNADIRISADFVRHMYTEFEEFVNPVRSHYGGSENQSNPPNQIDDISPDRRFWGTSNGVNPVRSHSGQYCAYSDGLTRQAAFAWSLLTARSFLEGKEQDAEKFTQDYVVDLLVHEVGHTLGLRHNFKASSIWSLEQLNDKDFTVRNSVSGSVMDYNPANIALDPAKQGEYWHSTIGPYDYWAIEYAYKPLGAKTPDEELPQLKEIGARSTKPELAYGTDEDAHGNSPRGIDPLCTLFDLGNDPIEYYKVRLALTRELWSKIEDKFTKPDERYYKLRRVFGQGLGEVAASTTVVRYIGGIYHIRDHMPIPMSIGTDEGVKMETIPMKPVDAAKQKAALDFIIQNIFSMSEETMPPARLLNKFAPEMMPDFVNSLGNSPSMEVQIHSRILGIQKGVLDYLYNPLVLARVEDMPMRLEITEEPFGLAELFAGLREGIWSELSRQENINSFRRNLQREYTERLINIFRTSPDNLPADAVSLARNDLVIIQQNIATALGDPAKLDVYTKAHLEDINSRITAALEWKDK